MLYNEYRPIIFDEVKGQEVPVKIIRNQAKNLTAHAFIFAGKHGTGKTTLAKIFARALNCEQQQNGNPCNTCSSCQSHFNGTNYDIVEIDGASNNSVEDIRSLQDKLIYPPRGRKKVYIIDEVHMLSTGAFNALLKTLEEPPEYAVFIFCTTEINKIPSTIRSRCLEINFSNISEEEILNNIRHICKKEGYSYEEGGLKLISQVANGSMRDALSILEKCLTYGELTNKNISDVLGIVDINTVVKIVKYIIAKNPELAIKEINELYNMGKDFSQLVVDLIRIFRNLMVLQTTEEESLFDININLLKGINISEKDCFNAINHLSELLTDIKYNDSAKVLVEIYLMQLSSMISGSINPEKSKMIQRTTNDNLEGKEEINHYNYLVNKVDLIKSYSINSKEIPVLMNAQVYVKRDSFIIRTKEASVLNINDIKQRMKKITGKDLNIKIISE